MKIICKEFRPYSERVVATEVCNMRDAKVIYEALQAKAINGRLYSVQNDDYQIIDKR